MLVRYVVTQASHCVVNLSVGAATSQIRLWTLLLNDQLKNQTAITATSFFWRYMYLPGMKNVFPVLTKCKAKRPCGSKEFHSIKPLSFFPQRKKVSMIFDCSLKCVSTQTFHRLIRNTATGTISLPTDGKRTYSIGQKLGKISLINRFRFNEF